MFMLKQKSSVVCAPSSVRIRECPLVGTSIEERDHCIIIIIIFQHRRTQESMVNTITYSIKKGYTEVFVYPCTNCSVFNRM